MDLQQAAISTVGDQAASLGHSFAAKNTATILLELQDASFRSLKKMLLHTAYLLKKAVN